MCPNGDSVSQKTHRAAAMPTVQALDRVGVGRSLAGSASLPSKACVPPASDRDTGWHSGWEAYLFGISHGVAHGAMGQLGKGEAGCGSPRSPGLWLCILWRARDPLAGWSCSSVHLVQEQERGSRQRRSTWACPSESRLLRRGACQGSRSRT